MGDARPSSEVARFRYTLWPAGRLDPPAVTTWRAEHQDGWFLLGSAIQAQPPADLHVFEFARTDVCDPAAVVDFMASSGSPAPVVGFAGGPPAPWHDLSLGSMPDARRPGLDTLDERRLPGAYRRTVTEAAKRWDLPPPDLDARPAGGHAIHHAEVAVRFELVTTALAALLRVSEGGALDDLFPSWSGDGMGGAAFAAQLNAGLGRFAVRLAPLDAAVHGTPSAYEVACLLIANDLGERTPYRRCANDTCGRIFSRQRGRAEYGQYRSTGVTFCTPGCARAQSQRERRRKVRAEREEKHD